MAKPRAKRLHLYVFRHGQTTYNRDGRFTGWLDSRLTKKGVRDSKIVARKLKNRKFQVAIYTRLTRSTQTLREVMNYHPECKKLIEDNRMMERNYGKLNGMLHDTFIRKIGKRLLKLDIYGDALEDLSPTRRKKLEKFLGTKEYELIHRGYNTPPPGGESFADVEKRVRSFLKDLKKMMKKEQVNVAISAHGNSIRLLRKIMENMSKKETQKLNIPYDTYYDYIIK